MVGVDPRRRGVNSEVTEGMPKETEEEVKGLRPTHVSRILETILDGHEFEAGQCQRIKGADPDRVRKNPILTKSVEYRQYATTIYTKECGTEIAYRPCHCGNYQ